MIHVEDERVWEAYVKANLDARPFRNKVIDNCKDLIVICRQNHINGEGAETAAQGYEPSLESETNILEESSPNDEGLTSRGKAPTNAGKMRNKETGTSGRPIRKLIRPGDAIAEVVNYVAMAIDRAYTSESAKISSKKIFVNISEIEGLKESELLAYDALTQNARKFELFFCLPTQLKKPWLLRQTWSTPQLDIKFQLLLTNFFGWTIS